MKCKRPNCVRRARKRHQKLCDPHYRLAERGLIDPGPARAQLMRLHAAGYSWRRIGELAGLTEQGVYLIRDGSYDRIQKLTAKRILAVPVPGKLGGDWVDSTGTVRRVQALQAIGWSQPAIAAMMGLTRNTLRLQMKRPRISGRRAREVAELFDRLQMTPGPSDFARRLARRKGWAPPLAWDEDVIDDPTATPDFGEESEMAWIDRYNDARECVGSDDINQIAAQMGIAVESVQQGLRRHRRSTAA